MERIKENRKIDRTLEIIALVITIISLTLGFLALSNQIKIKPESIVQPDDLKFDINFSSNISGATESIEPILESKGYNFIAENAIIDNTKDPMITNLRVNFTAPGQKATYKFYAYNVGEYTGYLNSILYSNISSLNLNKICFKEDGTTNDEINNACKYINVYVNVGNTSTSKTLYNIESKSIRPRMSQAVEVVIEYSSEATQPLTPFEVVFGDIVLSYSMFNGYDD